MAWSLVSVYTLSFFPLDWAAELQGNCCLILCLPICRMKRSEKSHTCSLTDLLQGWLIYPGIIMNVVMWYYMCVIHVCIPSVCLACGELVVASLGLDSSPSRLPNDGLTFPPRPGLQRHSQHELKTHLLAKHFTSLSTLPSSSTCIWFESCFARKVRILRSWDTPYLQHLLPVLWALKHHTQPILFVFSSVWYSGILLSQDFTLDNRK